ncbi:polysaccharide pyruvyl transferase family protein [Aurantimonas sp. A2-1-M11]|uniref:polysaccharide pyruvyl transferase family protein n=1 Tax=Aurantimonas sp. A2-1-M11 TaxID=3113712 RepID=UPI002F921A70
MASILADRRELAATPSTEIFAEGVSDRDEGRRLVAQVSNAHSVRITDKSSIRDLALAALCRTPIEFMTERFSEFGFRTPEVSSTWADFNFDAAVDRFTIDSVKALTLRGQELQSVAGAYTDADTIPLFISTQQPSERIGRDGNYGNVGDHFGFHLIKRLTGRDVHPVGVWVEKDRPVVMTVGSIVDHARDRGLVWGSGCIQPLLYREKPVSTKSVYLGVRGPRTREQLIRKHGVNPRVVGDPGLFISDFLPEQQIEPDIDIGFVVHNADKEVFDHAYPGVFKVRNYESLQSFIEDFARCKAIVSTGLHGSIFSHASGKPCLSVKLGDRLTGGDFKFHDHAQSLGSYLTDVRLDLSGCPSLNELDWRELIASAWQPSAIPTRDRLLETFPFAIH